MIPGLLLASAFYFGAEALGWRADPFGIAWWNYLMFAFCLTVAVHLILCRIEDAVAKR